jgi:F-type H+-transporting ATPase subunit b
MMRFRPITVLACVALAMPATAMAAGMPQLDFKNPLTTSQVVWGALIFIVFYILFSRWGLPQVAEVLDQRTNTIAADLEAARAGKARVDAAAAEADEATARARGDAQAAINAATAKARAEAAAKAAELNEHLEAQLASAEQRIAEARTAAMGALRQVATETAQVVVNRLTGRPPDNAAIDRAVGQALAARGRG